MYYEIYMDVFFLVNFMMDYLLLAAVCRMLAGKFRRRRVLPGAVLGSLLTCLTMMLPVPGFVKLLLYHVAVNTVMIKAAIPVHGMREFVKAFFMLYGGGFLLGGIFSFFGQYIRTGSLFFLFAVVSYELMQAVWAFWRQMQRQNQYTCELLVEQSGRKVRLKGLIDTGNSLTDPLTGQPVCIVEREAVESLMESTQKRRYIGFRSVGNEHARLLLVRFDSLYLPGKEKKQICDIWIGISDTRISTDGTYRILVNPDIFRRGCK